MLRARPQTGTHWGPSPGAGVGRRRPQSLRTAGDFNERRKGKSIGCNPALGEHLKINLLMVVCECVCQTNIYRRPNRARPWARLCGAVVKQTGLALPSRGAHKAEGSGMGGWGWRGPEESGRWGPVTVGCGLTSHRGWCISLGSRERQNL